MKPLFKQLFLAVAACVLFVAPVLATNCNTPPAPVICPIGQIATKGVCAQPTPDQGLALLQEGNRDYVKWNLLHLAFYANPAARTQLATSQHPYAIVLSCSDSRVPPEVVFDKGLGEIFTVRVAGNVVAPHELGSIEYAIEHLGANLIVVLGHERCGAVTATYNAYPGHVEGNIGSLTESIYPAVKAVVGTDPKDTNQSAQIEECILENITQVKESLLENELIKPLVEAGTLKVVGAKYDLDTGIVTFQQ